MSDNTRPIPPRFILVQAQPNGELHALAPEQTTGPALCTHPEPPAPGWRYNGFTVQLDRIECAGCWTFAEALAGLARSSTP